MTDKMDAQITLTTSDAPSVSLTISRSALVTQSKVFGDMLSLDLKSEDGDNSIALAETEKDLSALVTILESTEDAREEALKKLGTGGWISLAKMADKYDCWSVRKLVEAHAWEVNVSESQYGGSFAFALAVLTNNVELIKHTAKSAVKMTQLPESYGVPPIWKKRLEQWRLVQMGNVLESLRAYARRAPAHSHKKCREVDFCLGNDTWATVVGKTIKNLDLCATPPLKLKDQVADASICDNYKEMMKNHFESVERDISQWTEFPFNI